MRTLREQEGALLLDSGDCIKAGNLAIPVREDPAWGRLHAAGCSAGVLGNRETHPLASAFEAKLRGARHPLLCANLRAKGAGEPPPLPGSLVLQHKGVRVGILGVMVPMVTERMASKAASHYLWDPPLPRAAAIARALRPDVDVLIALTHIGHRQDLELAAACPEIDVILGGHSHTVLEQPVLVGKTAVCQGGSHARFVGVYSWESGRGGVEGRLVPLD
ncbi:MAG: hypothetical protein M9921_07560 [Fimbriimonadaceae bacterium]|nr:hypothetical protein [Fimbriimonadaceae bacterium]